MKKLTTCLALAVSICTPITALQAKQWDHEAFALKLFQTAAKDQNENFVISPYSVASAFGLAASGAKGETATEMQQALGFSKEVANDLLPILAKNQQELFSKTNQYAKLELSNSLWPEMSFSLDPAFVAQAVQQLGAKIQPIPMNNVGQKMINNTVSEATHGRIPTTFTEPPNPNTRLILINTIYFNGKWMSPFNQSDVDNLPFSSPKGEIKVPFLRQVKTLPFYEDQQFSLLRLPYRGQTFEMVFLLPNSKLPLADFERTLASATLHSAIDKSSVNRVDIELPKFEFDATISLNATMQEMGMKRAFSPSADFSGITKKEGKELFISDAFQKANITVDEEGTVASAVTAIAMMRAALPPRTPPKEFHADRPFLFLIRHVSTGQILFLGRVTSPTPPAEKKR